MSALDGVRILELAESVAGEYCGKLLGDFGAELIKIEAPGIGSPTRRLGPFAPQGDDPERSGLFAYLNTNKQSVEVDLASVAPGNAVNIVFEALPDHTFPGQIISVDPVLVDVDGTPAVQS